MFVIFKISCEIALEIHEPSVFNFYNVEYCHLIKLRWVTKVDSQFGYIVGKWPEECSLVHGPKSCTPNPWLNRSHAIVH